MKDAPDQSKSRRDFFRSILRYAALGGLIGGGAALLLRPTQDYQCINDNNCRDCSRRCDCPLSNYTSPGSGPECSGNT